MRRALRAGLVAAILIVALVLRIDQVNGTDSTYRPRNDAGSYLTLASEIAHTGDYSLSHNPGSGAGGTRGPSAYYAPGYPYLLALVDILDGHEVRRDGAIHPARISQAVLGTITVALIGLVALEMFGAVAGWIALVLATVYPVLIEMSGTLVAENLLTPLVLAAVYAGLRVRRAGRAATAYAWVAGAGLLAGLATLTHENAILLVPPLMWAAWRAAAWGSGAWGSGAWGSGAPGSGAPGSGARGSGAVARRLRLGAIALLLAVTALAIAPWTIRNALVMHTFIPVSDETGITLVGTYNVVSAADPQIPYKWRIFYGIPGERPLIREAPGLTEPQIGDRLQSQALHYVAKHPFSPFSVVFHNTLRMFELEGKFAWTASASAQAIPTHTAGQGVVGFWIVCVLAIAGAFTRLVRAAPKWVWFVPLLLGLSVALVNVETPRFRGPVDPFLILLAAAGLASAFERIRAALRRAPVGREAGDAVPARPAQLVEVRERLA